MCDPDRPGPVTKKLFIQRSAVRRTSEQLAAGFRRRQYAAKKFQTRTKCACNRSPGLDKEARTMFTDVSRMGSTMGFGVTGKSAPLRCRRRRRGPERLEIVGTGMTETTDHVSGDLVHSAL